MEIAWFSVIQGVSTRLLLICHCAVVVWRVNVIRQELMFWINGAVGLILMLTEGLVTAIKKKGNEWKWYD